MDKSSLDSVAENFLAIFSQLIKYTLKLGDIVADPGFSTNEYEILHVLKAFGAVPISTVGSRLEISKPRMTPLVDKLAAAGLLERRPDRSDRRIIKLELTPRGWEFIQNHYQKLHQGVSARFSSLSEDQGQRFLQAMSCIQGFMEQTKTGENTL